MLMSGFPEECLSTQWYDVEQSSPKLDIVCLQNKNKTKDFSFCVN